MKEYCPKFCFQTPINFLEENRCELCVCVYERETHTHTLQWILGSANIILPHVQGNKYYSVSTLCLSLPPHSFQLWDERVNCHLNISRNNSVLLHRRGNLTFSQLCLEKNNNLSLLLWLSIKMPMFAQYLNNDLQPFFQ